MTTGLFSKQDRRFVFTYLEVYSSIITRNSTTLACDILYYFSHQMYASVHYAVSGSVILFCLDIVIMLCYNILLHSIRGS